MAPRSIQFFFVLILALSFHQILVNAHKKNGYKDLIAEICNRVPMQKHQCKTILNLRPEMVKTNDAKVLIRTALKLALAKGHDMRANVRLQLKKNYTDKYVVESLRHCADDYQTAMFYVKETLDALKSKTLDYVDTSIKIGEALTHAVGCTDGWAMDAPMRIKSIETLGRRFERALDLSVEICRNEMDKELSAPAPATAVAPSPRN